jgi:hypothetical protein
MDIMTISDQATITDVQRKVSEFCGRMDRGTTERHVRLTHVFDISYTTSMEQPYNEIMLLYYTEDLSNTTTKFYHYCNVSYSAVFFPLQAALVIDGKVSFSLTISAHAQLYLLCACVCVCISACEREREMRSLVLSVQGQPSQSCLCFFLVVAAY